MSYINMTVPETCGKCRHIGRYKDGPYARNPHCCCELIWRLYEEDYRVKENTLDPNCPLKRMKIREDFDESFKETV